MKTKRLILVALAVIFCLSLVACGGGDLPKFKGSKKLSESEAKEIFSELTGGKSVPQEIEDAEGFIAEGDENDYLDYVGECVENGYVNQGNTVIDGVMMTMLAYPAKDLNVACLVAYRNGEIYVVQFSYESFGPSKREFVWPTAEELALFHVNLTKPTGEVEGFVSISDPSKDILVAYESLVINIENASNAQFEVFKSDLTRSGYTLGARMDSYDGNKIYIAKKVVGGEEFSCDLRYEVNNVSLNLENETKKATSDYGATLYDAYPTATIGFKIYGKGFFSSERGTDDKNGESVWVERMGTTYSYLSYDDRYVVEFSGFGEDDYIKADEDVFDFLIENNGGWLYDVKNSSLWSSNGEMLETENYNPEFFTVKTMLYSRSIADINRYYISATNLQKSTKTRNIAGITCAEYVGQISMNNGENVWDATFYVWEEKNVPMSYTGQRWFDDDSDYSIEVCYINRECVGDKFLTISPALKWEEYPEELVEQYSRLPFDFSVDGAEGYTFNTSRIEYDKDGNEVECKEFFAQGVDENEADSFIQKLKGYNFYEESVYENIITLYYNVGGGDRVKITCMYENDGSYLLYWFTYEDNDTIVVPPTDTFVAYEYINNLDNVERCFFKFLEDGLYIGFFGKEEYRMPLYYKYDGENYLKYRAEPWYNLEDHDCEAVTASSVMDDIMREVNFSPFFSGKGYEVLEDKANSEYGVPVTVYGKDRARVTVWTEYSIILDLEQKSYSLNALCFEKGGEFSTALPQIDLVGQTKNKFQRALSLLSMGQAHYDWKMEFMNDTYDGYRYSEYWSENTSSDVFDQFYQELISLKNNGWRTILFEENTYGDEWSEDFDFSLIMTRGEKRATVISGRKSTYAYDNGESSDYFNLSIEEFDVLTTVQEYFGEEYNAEEKQYIDYSKIDGRYTFTADNEHIYADDEGEIPPSPMRHEVELIVDLGGLLVISSNQYASFNGQPSFGSLYRLGDRIVVNPDEWQRSEKTAGEYVSTYLGQTLTRAYNVNEFIDCVVSAESVAGVACKKYSGKYIYRGQALEIAVWRAEDGRNMKVRIENPRDSANRSFYIIEILSFEQGEGKSGIADISKLPVMGVEYPASEWKEEYYGYDFVPRAEGFTHFMMESNTVYFYNKDGGTITLSPSSDSELVYQNNGFYKYFDDGKRVRMGISNYNLSSGGTYVGEVSIYMHEEIEY